MSLLSKRSCGLAPAALPKSFQTRPGVDPSKKARQVSAGPASAPSAGERADGPAGLPSLEVAISDTCAVRLKIRNPDGVEI